MPLSVGGRVGFDLRSPQQETSSLVRIRVITAASVRAIEAAGAVIHITHIWFISSGIDVRHSEPGLPARAPTRTPSVQGPQRK
jgi:hypothetical protein